MPINEQYGTNIYWKEVDELLLNTGKSQFCKRLFWHSLEIEKSQSIPKLGHIVYYPFYLNNLTSLKTYQLNILKKLLMVFLDVFVDKNGEEPEAKTLI